jgi:hypothetical protein
LAKALTVDAPHIPSPGSVMRPARYLRPRVHDAGSSSEMTLEACDALFRECGPFIDDATDALDGGACCWRYGECCCWRPLGLGALRPMIKFSTL